jgi:hypothetical protein
MELRAFYQSCNYKVRYPSINAFTCCEQVARYLCQARWFAFVIERRRMSGLNE